MRKETNPFEMNRPFNEFISDFDMNRPFSEFVSEAEKEIRNWQIDGLVVMRDSVTMCKVARPAAIEHKICNLAYQAMDAAWNYYVPRFRWEFISEEPDAIEMMEVWVREYPELMGWEKDKAHPSRPPYTPKMLLRTNIYHYMKNACLNVLSKKVHYAEEGENGE